MDTHGKRPGGLTALAVLNFVFGGLGVLAVVAYAALFAIVGGGDVGPEQREVAKSLEEAGGMGVLGVTFALSLISTVLLIASGVGYLKLRRVLGRIVGNAYAVTSIVSTIVGAALMPVDAGGGFGLMSIIGLIYPVLTLILLNTTFKDDLVQ